jgi:hypothetical protein
MRKIMFIILLFASCVYGVVSNQTARIMYSCDGADTTFTFAFPILDSSDLTVILRTTATGDETVLTEAVHYSVTATNNEYASGGTVTTVSTYSSAYEILLLRNTPMTQATDLDNSGVLRLEALEDALDKLTMLVLQLQEESDRSLKIPRSDDVSSMATELDDSVSRASTYLAFSASGAATATASVAPSTATITAYMETVLDDADADTARATLLSDEDLTSIEVIDVTHADYGAVGDGVTDDHDAFETALATGKTVFVPYTASGYLLNGAVIRQTTGNMILIGDTRRPTIKTTAEKQMFNPDGCDLAVFKNLILQGTSKCIIDNIYCTGFTDYGIRVAHPNSLYATNLEITNSGYSGLAVVNGAGPYIFDGVRSYSNAGSGVNFEVTTTAASTTGGFQNITLKNVTSYGNTERGVVIGTGTKTTAQLQTAGYYYDTAGQTDNMGNIRLENVQCWGNSEEGVLIRGFEVMMRNVVSRENTKDGFLISQPYVGYAPVVNMSNCFAVKNSQDGFALDGDTTRKTYIMADGCRAKDNTRYGFNISTSAVFDYLSFSNCESSGNVGTGGSTPFDVHTLSSYNNLEVTNNCIGFYDETGRYDVEMHKQALPVAAGDAQHIRIPKGAIIRKIAIDVDTEDSGASAGWIIQQSDASVTYATVVADTIGYRELVPTGNTLDANDTDANDIGFLELSAFNNGIKTTRTGTFVEDGSGTVYVEYWYGGILP